MIKIFNKETVEDFQGNDALPTSQEQSKEWQNINKSWWEKNSMRYDFTEKIHYEEFTKEFYEEIDKRFFSSVWQRSDTRFGSFERINICVYVSSEENLRPKNLTPFIHL